MKKIFFVFVLLLNFSLFAQLSIDVISVPSGNDRLNVCDEEETFTVQVINSGTSKATDVFVKFQLLKGIRVENVVTSGVSLESASTDELPVFELPDIDVYDHNDPDKNKVTFSFTVKVHGDFMENFVGVNGSYKVQNLYTQAFCKYSNVDHQSSPELIDGYTVKLPEFLITIDDGFDNQNQGVYTPFTRQFRVKNSGLGRAFTLKLRLDYTFAANPGVQYIGLKYRRDMADPWLTVTGAVSNNGVISVVMDLNSNPLDTNEIIFFEETAKITACPPSPLLTKECIAVFYAENYCGNGLVTRDSVFTNVNAFKDRPKLSTEMELVSQSDPAICSGSSFVERFILKNVGYGANANQNHIHFARNVKAIISFEAYRTTGSVAQFEFFDKSINAYKVIPASCISPTPSALTGCSPSQQYEITFANLVNTPYVDIDGAGYGLADLDQDGRCDDLPLDSTLDIRVTFPTSESSTVCNSCSEKFHYKLTFSGQWSTECNGTDFTTTTPVLVKEYMFSIGSTSMTGPTDMVRNDPPKDFSLSFNGVSKTEIGLNCTAANFTTEVIMPLGYFIDYANNPVYWIANGTTTQLQSMDIEYTPTSSNNTYKFKLGGVAGEYKFKVLLNCDSNLSSAEKLNVFWNVNYACSANCSPRMLACDSFEIFNHCRVCPAGVHTTSASAERTSLGWYLIGNSQTYQTLKTQPRLVYNSLTPSQKAELRLDRLMPFDTLTMKATGVIHEPAAGVNYSNPYVELKYESDYLVNEFEVLSAVIRVKDYTPGCTTCVPSTVDYNVLSSMPAPTRNAGVVVYKFPLPSGITLGDMDEFDLSATFEVSKDIDNSSSVIGEHTLRNFRFYHYGTRSGDTQGSYCESFGSRVSLISHYREVITWFNTDEYCDLSNALFIEKHSTRSDESDDFFGNEFRPWGIFKKIKYTGTGPVPFYSPHKIQNMSNAFKAPATYEEPFLGSSQLPPPHYPNEWDYSMWNIHDDHSDVLLGLLLPLKCYHTSNMPFQVTFQPYFYVNNAAVQTANQVTYTRTINNNNLFPNLSLTGSDIEQAITKEASWELKLSNTGGAAMRSWAALEPEKDDVRIIEIVERNASGTVVHPVSRTYTYTYTAPGGAQSQRTGYMIELGTIGNYTVVDLDVIAEYDYCDEGRSDDIVMKVSYGCTEYPLDPYHVTCPDRPVIVKTLELQYRQASMQQKLDKISIGDVNGAYPICEEIVYQAKITSTNHANMNTIQLHFDLGETTSNGASFVAGSFEYEYAGATGVLPMPVKDPTSYKYTLDLSSLAPLKDNLFVGDLYGSDVAGSTGKDALKVNFKVKTNCSFDPAKPLFYWNFTGKKNCGEDVILIKEPERLKIQGLEELDDLSMTADITSYDVINKKVNFTVTVTNNSQYNLFHTIGSTVKRRVFIGQYSKDPGFVSQSTTPASQGTYQPNEIIFNYWDLPDLPAGGTYVISGTYSSASASEDGFCPFVLISHVKMFLPSVCNGTTCDVGAEIASAFDEIKENCCKDCLPSLVLEGGKRYVVSVWVKQKQSSSATTYKDAGISLYFQEAATVRGPFFPDSTKDNIIDGWQRIDKVFDVPLGTEKLEVRLINNSQGDAYFDDLRIHPFNSSLKAFVYDPNTLRLWSELDERNYATFYEYDQEGGLVRVKKETQRGVMTITESRSNTIKVSKQQMR